jgi:hypothetical protein
LRVPPRRPDAKGGSGAIVGMTPDRTLSMTYPVPMRMDRPVIAHGGTIAAEAAHFVIVAYSTFSQPARPSPRIMALPVEMPPMAGTFVACVVEERSGNSIPRAAIIFRADVNFDCPQMSDFILRLIDSVDVIRRLSRKTNARVVASQFVLKNPLAELDREKCQEIFDWQYLGHSRSVGYRLM